MQKYQGRLKKLRKDTNRERRQKLKETSKLTKEKEIKFQRRNGKKTDNPETEAKAQADKELEMKRKSDEEQSLLATQEEERKKKEEEEKRKATKSQRKGTRTIE
jgi:hypothetical protein